MMNEYTDSQAAALENEPRECKPGQDETTLRNIKSQVWFAYHVALLNGDDFSPIFVH